MVDFPAGAAFELRKPEAILAISALREDGAPKPRGAAKPELFSDYYKFS
jgi:hypothetical protein